MADQKISRQLLQQRIRNRIIEYLELAASAERQRDYERRAPIAQVPGEMINQWADVVHADNWDWYSQPVFSIEESEAIRAFHDVWLAVADETPEPMPHTIEALIGTPAWNRLMAAARDTLQVLSLRGRFDEEIEERLRG
jgi:hypothetical protein